MPSRGHTSPQHHSLSGIQDWEVNRAGGWLLSPPLRRSGHCAVLSLPPHLLLPQFRVPGRTGIPKRKAGKPQVPRSTLPTSLPIVSHRLRPYPNRHSRLSSRGSRGRSGGGRRRLAKGLEKAPSSRGGVPLPQAPSLGRSQERALRPGPCTAPASLVPQVGVHSLPFSSSQP